MRSDKKKVNSEDIQSGHQLIQRINPVFESLKNKNMIPTFHASLIRHTQLYIRERDNRLQQFCN